MPLPEPIDRKLSDIRALAAAHAWGEIESALRGLPQWLAGLAEPDRRDALGRLAAFVESLGADVKARSDAVGAELRALRTGRRAVGHYRQSTRAAAEFDLKREV